MIEIKNRWTGGIIMSVNAENLRGADLRDAKNAPLLISGMRWHVLISGTGWMQIGCQLHSISEWADFEDSRIASMASDALEFWHANKAMLLGLCDQWKHGEEK